MRLQTMITCGLLLAAQAWATGTYLAPDEFVSRAFDGDPPAPARLWIKGELKERARDVLGHAPGQLRMVYWGRGQRTAWVLEEIGKEQPITTGIVVEGDRIVSLQVLVFRESRGWEVRYPFFTDQFRDQALVAHDRLAQPVDGISGATLSVGALSRLARLALLMHQYTPFAGPSPGKTP